MNRFRLYSTPTLLTVIMLISLIALEARAQTADTSSALITHGGALQFQLLRNFGVYYFGHWGSSSYFRIGADASFLNSNTSGTTQSNDAYSGSSGSSSTGKPERATSSFGINVSALWIQTIAEYARSSLYFGAGPMLSYGGYGQNSSSTETNVSYPPGNSTVSTYDDKSRSWGAGPLALLGVRAHIVGPVNVTAEMSVYAIYESTTTSNVSTSKSTDFSSFSYVSVHTGSSDTHGWEIALNSIAIGVVIDL